MPKTTPVAERLHLNLPRPLIPMTRATSRKLVPGPIDSVLIIGAGLSGLSAGLRLRGSGIKVTILEAQPHVGGRCATEELTSDHGPFHADTGATVLTMPQLVDAAITSAGVDPSTLQLADGRRWSTTRLSPGYRGEFSSGRHLRIFSDEDAMVKELIRFATDKHSCPPNAPDVTRLIDGYAQHRAWTQSMFTLSYDNFLASDFDRLTDVISTPAAASSMGRLLAAGAFSRLGSVVSKHIQDPEVERLLTFQALYAGTAPASALGVYSVISHMDVTMGVHYPAYSIGDAAEFMAEAFVHAGGELRLGSPVTELVTEGKSVVGARVASGEIITASATISTTDLPITAAWLGADKHLSTARYSPSAVVVHGTIPTGTSATWRSQQHHTLSFGTAWDEIFHELTARAGRGKVMSDPSLLITRPGRTVTERIRSAHGIDYEPISILAPAPNLESAAIAWDVLQDHYVREILSTLESRGFTGMSTDLSIARVDTPLSFAAEGYGAGSPFSLAHTLGQTGPFRLRNYPAFGYSNLILAGCGTTPGVGVPTVLLSGALAARRITGGGVR